VLSDTVNSKAIVGETIRELRRQRALSQDELAARCGIYRTYLSRIETGEANPTLIVLVALAGALMVTPAELLARL
jgi:transcriptional regulator with XRE-family HTH domain